MPLVSMRQLLDHAAENGYGLPAFNVNNMEQIQAIMEAANDIHGKNHHVAGCFGEHVRRLTLRVADGRIVHCSDREEPELFRATIGGMGLTGHILEVEFRMQAVPSPWIWGESERIADLDAMVAGLKEADRGPDTAEETMVGVRKRFRLMLEKNLAFLGTVGNNAPFIGLFGTVWGIMNSFRSLGNAQQATLSMVAPGIAEALIATAKIGILAASLSSGIIGYVVLARSLPKI